MQQSCSLIMACLEHHLHQSGGRIIGIRNWEKFKFLKKDTAFPIENGRERGTLRMPIIPSPESGALDILQIILKKENEEHAK